MFGSTLCAGCILATDEDNLPKEFDDWLQFIENPPSEYRVDTQKMILFYDHNYTTKSFKITYIMSGVYYSFDIALASSTLSSENNGFYKLDNVLDNDVYIIKDESVINPKVTNIVHKQSGKSVCSILYLTPERYDWMTQIIDRYFDEK